MIEQQQKEGFKAERFSAADLPALVVVWEVAVAREASGTELLAGVGVLVGLWEDSDYQQPQQNANFRAPSVSITV